MKEIMIASVIVTFVGFAMVGFALWVVAERNNSIARNAIEQTDFENYVFIMPDGATFRPIDGFED